MGGAEPSTGNGESSGHIQPWSPTWQERLSWGGGRDVVASGGLPRTGQVPPCPVTALPGAQHPCPPGTGSVTIGGITEVRTTEEIVLRHQNTELRERDY